MRDRIRIESQSKAVLSHVGYILVLAGWIMLLPLLIVPFRPEESRFVFAFAAPAAALFLSGAALRRGFRSHAADSLSVQEGSVVVLLGWLSVALFSALPFVLSGELAFSRAFFESMSGWTTTGLSVVDVTKTGRTILLWRSIMQLAGGAGFAILMISAAAGPTGTGLSSAEGRADQLVPHVKTSARLVLAIYGCYAAVGFFAYWLAGMSPFDAVNHSFAAVSTGGFSTRPESIGFWDSVAVEAVTVPLMILGNMSFVTAWYLWRGDFGVVSKNGEIRLLAVVLPVAIAIVFIATGGTLYPRLDKAVRVAVFEVVTALTTTGFSTVTYEKWNSTAIIVLVVLMLIGGGTCSTAGGMKQYRVYLAWKSVLREIGRLALPRGAVRQQPFWEGGRRAFIDDVRLQQTASFVFLYLATYAAGALLLSACGFGLQDSLFEFASALGTVGLSVGVTGAGMPDAALWAETAAMFLGRLEFFVVFIGFFRLVRGLGSAVRNTARKFGA